MPINYDPILKMYNIPIREVCDIIEKIPMHKRHKGSKHAFTILALDGDKIMNVTEELYNTWLGNMDIIDQEKHIRYKLQYRVGVYIKNPSIIQTQESVYTPQTTIDEEVENDEESEDLLAGVTKDSDFMIEVDSIPEEKFRELEHQDIMDEWSRLQKSD